MFRDKLKRAVSGAASVSEQCFNTKGCILYIPSLLWCQVGLEFHTLQIHLVIIHLDKVLKEQAVTGLMVEHSHW